MTSGIPLIARIDISSSGDSIRRLTEAPDSPQGTVAGASKTHITALYYGHVSLW